MTNPLDTANDDPSLSVQEQYGIGMPTHESGVYWMYTLDSEGDPIESEDHPSICEYNKETGNLSLMGYDVPMEFNYDNYRLIKRIEFRGQS